MLAEQKIVRLLHKEVQDSRNTWGNFLYKGYFSIRSTEDANTLAVQLASFCPDPIKSVLGLGELLVNAVEHGNLGITYSEKTLLNGK